ncbi:hypothetical protein TNCV_4793491 [Trichonephila clavipes]|nr:hypothetical protein TNCV_4793491 [Trichonephila clavipes]
MRLDVSLSGFKPPRLPKEGGGYCDIHLHAITSSKTKLSSEFLTKLKRKSMKPLKSCKKWLEGKRVAVRLCSTLLKPEIENEFTNIAKTK